MRKTAFDVDRIGYIMWVNSGDINFDNSGDISDNQHSYMVLYLS